VPGEYPTLLHAKSIMNIFASLIGLEILLLAIAREEKKACIYEVFQSQVLSRRRLYLRFRYEQWAFS